MNDEPIDEKKISSKQKIFDAAVSLFAQKGFYAVSTREIVKKAGVNIAMINYHYGSKIGVLKAIINKAYEQHEKAITDIDKNLSAREHVRAVIKNFIDFFRANTELALVAFDVLPYDIPEILELKQSWGRDKHALLKRLFELLGLNINDPVQVNLFNGFLGNMVLNHFLGRYYWEKSTHTPPVEFDDNFYKRYADSLTNFYMAGVKALLAKKR